MRRRGAWIAQYIAFALALGVGLTLLPHGARAAFTQYDDPNATYDINKNPIPQFVDTVYIDLNKITAISKFRSGFGHDYSDTSQFNVDAYADPALKGVIEGCASMKHYFMAPDASVQIVAPVSGVVSRMFDESVGGTQVQITSDVQPAFTFTMFHVVLTTPLAEGSRVTAGQVLGHHTGTQTWSDIAVIVHTARGYHLISYFQTLTDKAFAAFQARGAKSRDDFILSRAYSNANPVFYCVPTGQPQPILNEAAESVTLTGGASTQSITAPAFIYTTVHVGDDPVNVAASATSGLPVTVMSRTPKVCMISGAMLSWRRPGMCYVVFSQGGDGNTFAARDLEYGFTVLPAGAPTTSPPVRLGGIYPPGQIATQSYLRFHNLASTAATVTLSLLNGDTGSTITKWTSPPIPPNAATQFSISDLEAAATTPFTRPTVYGVKIEPQTTLYGYMQHIFFNPVVGALTNASSCAGGVDGNPDAFGFVFSTLFTDYLSAFVLANPTSSIATYGLDRYSAQTGAAVAAGYSYPFVLDVPEKQSTSANGEYLLNIGEIETREQRKPDDANSIYTERQSDYRAFSAYVQYLVTSVRANIVGDLTAACSLGGASTQTIASPLYTASVYSPSPALGQSYFRLYNAGAVAGTAKLILHDPDTGAVLGQWTTPTISAGAENQYDVASIESAPGFTKKSRYTLTVETDIDGYFQHVLYRAPDGALSSMNTCFASTLVDGATLIGVHSSIVAAAGYPSTVVVNNTGTEAATADLEIIDARDGSLLKTYTTPAIPTDGQMRLDMAAVENSVDLKPTGSMGHYVIKLRDGFTGYLQHFVNNQAAGVVTDMTAMCAM